MRISDGSSDVCSSDPDPFAGNAADGRIRLLAATGDNEAALAEARKAVETGPPSVGDWTRLGDLYGELERPQDAAGAYGRAVAVAEAQGTKDGQWALWLLRGGAFDQAGNWPEAKAALEAAYRLAPPQPIVLTYLGYAQLDRRETVEVAMRHISAPSRLQTDTPALTASLARPQSFHGNIAQAPPPLQKPL